MRVSLCLLFSIVGAYATCTNTEIFDCFSGFIDTDNDGSMNSTEFDAFWTDHPCGRYFPKNWGTEILDSCDINENGGWDANDLTTWKSCLNVISLHDSLCDDCAMCTTQTK